MVTKKSVGDLFVRESEVSRLLANTNDVIHVYKFYTGPAKEGRTKISCHVNHSSSLFWRLLIRGIANSVSTRQTHTTLTRRR